MSEIKTFDELPEEVQAIGEHEAGTDAILVAYNAGLRAGQSGGGLCWCGHSKDDHHDEEGCLHVNRNGDCVCKCTKYLERKVQQKGGRDE